MAGELEKRVREMMHKMDAKDWDSLNQMATDDLRRGRTGYLLDRAGLHLPGQAAAHLGADDVAVPPNGIGLETCSLPLGAAARGKLAPPAPSTSSMSLRRPFPTSARSAKSIAARFVGSRYRRMTRRTSASSTTTLVLDMGASCT